MISQNLCNSGTPLVSPTNLVEDVCFVANGATQQGTKTVATVGGTTTVVFRDRSGAVVVGAREVACPPLVMVVNACPCPAVAPGGESPGVLEELQDAFGVPLVNALELP